jgi:hypothetical protein
MIDMAALFRLLIDYHPQQGDFGGVTVTLLYIFRRIFIEFAL